jgi:butyrate kinase
MYGEHASNLGCLLADRLKDEFGLENSYTADSVSCTNISKVAEISGIPSFYGTQLFLFNELRFSQS